MIQPFLWSDAFSVGDAGLDDEHRRIVELINEICISADAGQRQRGILLLSELQFFSEVHFRNEEVVLARIASEIDQQHLHTVVQSAVEQHARMHRWELYKLHKLVENARASKGQLQHPTLCDNLKTWFIDHAVGPEAQVKTILQSTHHFDQVK